MKLTTVIWCCPRCDYWEWGNMHETPDICPICGADMGQVGPDRELALETHACLQFHRRNEERMGNRGLGNPYELR
ncbi:hypothetical protein ACFL2Q_08150 [Thermodesulfobacteriota bacterium]